MIINLTPKEVFHPSALLYVLCGNVGTGKTTFRKELVVYLKSLDRTVMVINADEILSSLDGGSSQEYTGLKHEIMTQIKKMVLEKTGENQAVECFDPETAPILVVDNMNSTSKHRIAILTMVQSRMKTSETALYRSVLLDFGCGNDRSLKRRIEGRPDISPQNWEEAHERIQKTWESPSQDEGYTEIFRMEWVEDPPDVNTDKA